MDGPGHLCMVPRGTIGLTGVLSIPMLARYRRVGKGDSKVPRRFHDDLVEHYPGAYPLDLAAVTPMSHEFQAAMTSIGIVSTPIENLISMTPEGAISTDYPDVRITGRIARLLDYAILEQLAATRVSVYLALVNGARGARSLRVSH